MREQEPCAINPSGRKNLFALNEELKHFWPKDCLSFPFYGDGLPCVSYERIKSDSVDCVTHHVNIPLKDTSLLLKHCSEECELDWPLKNLYVIAGESHEEMAMHVVALTNSIPFGVLEMLSELGRYSKKSQLQAIRSKRLHTLNELNYIFTKGSFTAIAIPFLNYCEKTKSEMTVENLYKYVENSPNLQFQARFRALISLNMPCIVKRIGIRLDNNQIAEGGSALFFDVAFAMKMSWYRDFYFYKFINGPYTKAQEDIEPERPNFEKFLNQLDSEFVKEHKSRPQVRKYPTKHPQENIQFGLYKSKYSHLTERGNKVDCHEGGDFLQEAAIGRVMPFLRRGKIFSNENFADAVRRCQLSRDSDDQTVITEYERKRPKYQNEVQAISALILSKNCDPE